MTDKFIRALSLSILAEFLTSEGLTTTLFPAAKAGAIFLMAINKGWLNGYLAFPVKTKEKNCGIKDAMLTVI